MTAPEESFIERVARVIAQPGPNAPRGVRGSLLAQAARLHGLRPVGDESTAPTGFDPAATTLFVGSVEAAYLVASSDGALDRDEAAVLRAIVGVATDGKISAAEVEEMIDDLQASHAREGLTARAAVVSKIVTNRDHQREVLRIATVMSRASGGVRPEERALLEQLARGFSLAPGTLDALIAEVEEALGHA